MAEIFTQQPKIVMGELPPQKELFSLRCLACKKTGKYKVGRIALNPAYVQDLVGLSGVEALRKLSKIKWEKWAHFAGYFVCQSCGSGGPWTFAAEGKLMMARLMIGHHFEPDKSGIFIGMPVMFDGTVTRTGFEAVAYIKKLIEAEPTRAFLWSRLGNTFVGAEEPDMARQAFEKALDLDPNDVESRHSLAEIYLEKGDDPQAAHYYCEVLRHCRTGTWYRKDLAEKLVEHTLDSLLRIQQRHGGKISVIPMIEAVVGVKLRDFDLRSKDGWHRLVQAVLYGRVAEPRAQHDRWQSAPRSAVASSTRVGRNGPCPCGSGKKFKHCCLRNRQ